MKSMFLKSLAAGFVWLSVCAGAMADNWPQYCGPRGDGVSTEKILTAWPAGGPKRLWTAKTTGGFSSFAVGGGKIFTVVARNVDGAPVALCIALDADTCKEIWSAPTGVAIFQGGGDRGAEGNSGGGGAPFAPTPDGD